MAPDATLALKSWTLGGREIECERSEIDNDIGEWKLDIIALRETKMYNDDEYAFDNIDGGVSRVTKSRARWGVELYLSEKG